MTLTMLKKKRNGNLITIKQILLRLIDLITSSTSALLECDTSENNMVSKSIGAPIAFSTVWTEFISSGYTPSPGINVHVIRSTGMLENLSCKLNK